MAIAIGALAAPAWGADKSEAAAKAKYVAAQQAYDLGRFDEALKGFTEAYELKPLPGFLFNIAQCHRQLGTLERARFFYIRYLDKSPTPPKNAAQVEALITQMEQKLAEQQSAQRLEDQRRADAARARAEEAARAEAQRIAAAELARQEEAARAEAKAWPAPPMPAPQVEPPATARVEPPKVEEEPPPPEPAEEDPHRGWGPVFTALGGADVLGRSAGAELAAGYHFRALELTARVRVGPAVGVGLRAVYGLKAGPTILFAGLRGDAHPTVGAFGGGVSAGVRIPFAGGFSVVGDVCVQGFSAPAEYRSTALLLLAGIDWR